MLLLFVIGAGIALRLVLINASGAPERFEYDDLARSLAGGRGYVYDQLGTPYRSFYAGLSYIAINTATDWLFPSSPKAMLVVQSSYAGILALVIFHIARRFGSDRLAVAAAALVLCHPALLYYDIRKLHPLGFDSLMMMTGVWLLLRLRDAPGPARAFVAGAAAGLALFQRGSMALFFIGGLVWIVLYVARRAPARTARIVAAHVVGLVIVVVPWAARNYTIHGMLLLESMTPQQFWKGNATYSNGSGYLDAGRSVYDAAPDRLVEQWRQLDETGQFRLFRDEGIAEVRKDPARFVALVAKKSVYFWTVPPNSGQQYPPAYFAVYLAYYSAILALAVVGIWSTFRQPRLRPDAVLLLIYFASISIVHAIMFVEMRHRWGAEPMLLALVPAGARHLWMRWSR